MVWRTTHLQLVQRAQARAISANWGYPPPEPENEHAFGLHPVAVPSTSHGPRLESMMLSRPYCCHGERSPLVH